MKKYTKIICMVVAVCLLGAAAFCGFRIYSHYLHEKIRIIIANLIFLTFEPRVSFFMLKILVNIILTIG